MDWKKLSQTDVFGLHKREWVAKLYYNKSQRLSLAKAFVAQIADPSKVSFREAVFHLCGIFLHYASASVRFILLFDNNVIQDIIHHPTKPGRQPRFNALLASFSFAEDYCSFDVFGAITPTIMYEVNGRNPIESEADMQRVMATVRDVLLIAGLEVSCVGFDTLSQLKDAIQRIRNDETEILQALSTIKTKNWDLNISGGRWKYPLPFPMSVAEENVPDARLEYFNPWHVKYLLMHDIVKRLYAANEQNLGFRDFCKQELDKGLTSVLRTRKGRLDGLGDIELFSMCELASQTANSSPFIAMAVTFDNALAGFLHSRSHSLSPSASFRGSEIADYAAIVLQYRMWREQRKTNKINKKHKENIIEFRKFWRDNFVEFFQEDELPPSSFENET